MPAGFKVVADSRKNPLGKAVGCGVDDCDHLHFFSLSFSVFRTAAATMAVTVVPSCAAAIFRARSRSDGTFTVMYFTGTPFCGIVPR